MEWISIEAQDTTEAQELINWAADKAEQDCEIGDECCGHGNG